MSKQTLSIIILSSVLTFAAPSAFAQTSPEKAPKTSSQRNMQKGMASQDDIKKAQQALKDKGPYTGNVDGMMNADFEKALRDFQTENKLQATGKLDRATMSKLGTKGGGAAAPKPAKKGTKSGSFQSNNVREVQIALQGKGIDPGPIDGIMGPKTKRAVADFQRQQNLFASGKLDEKTKMTLGAGTLSTFTEENTRQKPRAPVQPIPVPPDKNLDQRPETPVPPGSTTGNMGLGTASAVEDIRAVQMALKNRGYDPGEINGLVSSQTQEALRKFQAANNLPVTGILDDRTQAALGVSVKGTSNPDFHVPPGPSGPSALEETSSGPSEQGILDKMKPGKHDSELSSRIEKSAEVVQELMSAGDKGIPTAMLENADAIVVIPNVTKAAFGIGGRFGKGVVSKRMANGRWGAPAFVSIGGGSFGAQFGVSSTDLVLVFTDKDALNRIEKGTSLKLGADAGVVAGPIGRTAEAGVTANLKSGIYAYSKSKGLFAGIALDGAVIDIDEDANHKVYGSSVDTTAILNNATMATNSTVRPFVSALNRVATKKPTTR